MELLTSKISSVGSDVARIQHLLDECCTVLNKPRLEFAFDDAYSVQLVKGLADNPNKLREQLARLGPIALRRPEEIPEFILTTLVLLGGAAVIDVGRKAYVSIANSRISAAQDKAKKAMLETLYPEMISKKADLEQLLAKLTDEQLQRTDKLADEANDLGEKMKNARACIDALEEEIASAKLS